MRIILVLLILLVNTQAVRFQTPVNIVIEKQEIIELFYEEGKSIEQSSSIIRFPKRDAFPSNRRITFKVINQSVKPVIIYGNLFDTNFYPAGYLAEFDKQNEKWKLPSGENQSEEINYMIERDKKILNPNESFEFTALMRFEQNKDKIFKRTIYFSYKDCDKTKEVSTSEFSLK